MKRIVVAGAALLSMSFFTGCGLKTQGGPGGGGDPCKTTGGVCKIAIAVAAGSCTNGSCVSADPDSRHVGDGTGKVKDVNLLWTLPNGYAFCGDQDGIFFKGDTQGQFSDHYGTDDGDGKPDAAAAKKKNFHWKDKNSVKGGPYPYTIKFHDDQCATAFEKDPDIINEM